MEKQCLVEEAAVETNNLIGQSDDESNTSGYLSSSLESSGEYFLDENYSFNVRERLVGRVARVPNTSTPKQDSVSVTFRKMSKRVTNESGRSLLSIKKTFNKTAENDQAKVDSFWDIQTPRKVFRCNSESDVNRKDRRSNDLVRNSIHASSTHDVGLAITKSRNMKSQNWKRKPFMTQSNSGLDSRLSKTVSTNNLAESTSKSKSYGALPRYRVKVDVDPVVSKNNSFEPRDGGIPVDESMSEFLSNVDRENLASFLMFYDKVTNSRRSTMDHEAVYF